MIRHDCRRRPSRIILIALGVTMALQCTDIEHPVAAPVAKPDTSFTPLWPIFSHDGKKVFFFGRLFGVPGMGFYELDTAGGAARIIMWDSLEKANPKLSPDGRKILYQAAEEHRLLCCSRLWVMNIDGTGAADCTPWGGYWQHHSWSPDGQSILASGPVEEPLGGINTQILRMQSDGSDPRLLTRGDSGSGDPRWDVDGSHIFYVTKHPTNELSAVVYVMNGDGTENRPVDSTHAGGSHPRPSPVRRELALLWNRDAFGKAGGYLVDYGASTFPTGEASFRRFATEFSEQSEWSPDGGVIAQLREGPSWSLTNDLYLVARDGSGVRRLTDSYRISFWNWSRDGRQIVFSSFSGEAAHDGFFIADVEQRTVRKLTLHR